MEKPYDVLATYYDYLQKDINYDVWLKQIECYPKDLTFLEIGCGTGKLADTLSKRGYKIDAFDISKPMIELAKKKNRTINFFVDNIITFNLNKKYDVIFCFMDTINYITNKALLEKSFANVWHHLKLDGSFLFDIHQEENINNFHGYLETGYVNNDEYQWYSHCDELTSRIITHDFTFIIKHKKYEERHFQLLESPMFYEAIFKKQFNIASKKEDEYRVYYQLTRK